MSQNPEIDPDATWNAEIDLSDPEIAWNFGTRELTAEEHERFAAATAADLDRVYAAREADEAYARWATANPDAAAQYAADFRAAEAEAGPEPRPVSYPAKPWLQTEPEPEAEIG
jgi:hypothetical protein